MPWECGECRQKETELIKISAVCHHCGKLLCDKHRIGILDDALSDFDGGINNIAFHCSSCKRTYHPSTIVGPTITKR